MTRAEFVERVERLAGLFEARGVAEGSTVTIGLPNSTGLVESLFAAWALGAVPQPISHRLAPLERTAIVDLANPAGGRSAGVRGRGAARTGLSAPAASPWLVYTWGVAGMEARHQRREHRPAEADRGRRAGPV